MTLQKLPLLLLMRIAINTRFLRSDYPEDYGYFLDEIFKRIVKKHPEHEFIYIFDQPVDQKYNFPKNVKQIVTRPRSKNPLFWKLWYDIKIPSLLRRHNADVFISCDGICSLTTKLPQCVLICDLSFLHSSTSYKKSHIAYLKKNTTRFLNKSKSIVTISEFSKQEIILHYKTEASKINVIGNAAKEIFQPVAESQKKSTKEKYTEGKEYFLYAGDIHPKNNLLNLLKAFSVFKKRLQSGMKLVLAGKVDTKYGSFIENLKTYKYRDDVLLINDLEEKELINIISSAYALIHPLLSEGLCISGLEAMKCNTPVITSMNSPMQEIAKDAALYIDPVNYNDIGEKMMLLYKDESLRKELIKKGNKNAAEYNFDKTTDFFWQSITRAMQ